MHYKCRILRFLRGFQANLKLKFVPMKVLNRLTNFWKLLTGGKLSDIFINEFNNFVTFTDEI